MTNKRKEKCRGKVEKEEKRKKRKSKRKSGK